MSAEKITGLVTQLHDHITTSTTSPEQEALLLQLHSQLENWEGAPAPDGSPISTAELLLEELDDNHPQLSLVIREIIDALGRIGI
ncbi:MAG: DUF4404 family protein [Pseudomonadota bacterium]